MTNATNLGKLVNFLLHRSAGDTMPLRANQLIKVIFHSKFPISAILEVYIKQILSPIVMISACFHNKKLYQNPTNQV